MNKKLLTAIAASVITVAGSSAAVADMNWFFSPYVGVDAQLRHMEFKKDFGKNVSPDDYPQGNVYVGAKFCDWLGVELGYESTIGREKRAVVLGNAIVFNLPADAGGPNASNTFDTRVRIHGPHINLVGFLPVSDDYRLQVFGSIGVAQLKIKINHDNPIARGAVNSSFIDDRRIFAKRKLIPRATVGLQHLMTNCFGVRASIGWENTSRFKDIRTVNVPSGLIARVRDSVNVGLGIFYNF